MAPDKNHPIDAPAHCHEFIRSTSPTPGHKQTIGCLTATAFRQYTANRMNPLVTVTLGILLVSIASARDITVSPGESLAKARDSARSGDRVILRGGTHRLGQPLVLGPQHSGVTWMAMAGESPVISGGVPVTGWTAESGGRYKATVKLDNFRQLWVNGQRATRARGAVPAGMAFWGKHEASVKKSDLPPGLSGTPGYFPGTLENIAAAGYTCPDTKLADWKNPVDMEFGYYTSWTHMISKVEKITKSDAGVIIEMSQPGFFLNCRKGGSRANQPAYMENALELLDEPGEWYFDRPTQTLHYLPRPGEDMTKAVVIAPGLEQLLLVKGTLDHPVRDVRFTGLTFAHATWLEPSTALGHPDGQANLIQPVDNSYFRPEHEKGWVPVNGEHVKCPANVVVDAGHAIRFDGCTFTALGGAGLDLQNGAQDNVVEGCRFHDISSSGIQIGDVTREDHHPTDPRRIVKNNRISNNVVTRIGVDYTDAIGIFYGYTEGTVIAHNEVFAVPYSGVSGGWGWGMPDAGGGNYACPIIFKTPTTCKNNRIEYNHIYDVMKVRHDGGCIYTLSRQPGSIIRGNHLHDSHAPFGGVYLDEGSAGFEVTGNVIYRAQTPVFYHTCGRDKENNTHDNFTSPPISATTGIKGHALAAGGVITVPHAANLDPERFTLSAWIRLANFPAGKDARRWVVCKAPNEHAEGNISLIVDGKNVGGYLNIGGGAGNCFTAASTNTPLPVGTWTHVAMTYDGDTLRVHCDGKEAATTRIGKPRKPGNGPLTLGARSDQFNTFDCGDIDQVRLYDHALTPEEIRNDAKGAQGGLVQSWDFDGQAGVDPAAEIIKKAGLEPQYRKLLDLTAPLAK